MKRLLTKGSQGADITGDLHQHQRAFPALDNEFGRFPLIKSHPAIAFVIDHDCPGWKDLEVLKDIKGSSLMVFVVRLLPRRFS